MAALALTGAIVAGCADSDGIAETPKQPAQTGNVLTLTTTVGLEGSAGTRALAADGTKTFAAGDQIAVVYKQKTGGAIAVAESVALTDGNITNNGKSATFTVTLDDPDKTKDVTYIYPAAMAGETGVDYSKLSSQTGGTLTDLGSKYDLATYTHAWDDDNLPTATLENQLAILAITLKDDAETPADITSTITGMTISDGTNSYAVTRSAAAGPIYVAIRPTTDATFNVTATDGTNNYVKTLTGKTYEINNGYNVGWRMLPAVINLSSVSGDITVINGQTLTGELNGNYKVSIAADAEVTLSGATIPGRNATELTTRWAGITCKGDATIVLADGTENYVKGYHPEYPGIQAGPTGKTLTIRGGSSGTGKLTAHCGMGTTNGYGAGIGGGQDMAVGNIRIEGGDITATASHGGAGIGSGRAYSDNASCGDITITGGTVTATGGSAAAGIGSGNGTAEGVQNYCGNITITGGTVTTTGGYGAAGIGSGLDFSSCDDITITGGTGTATGGTNSPYDIGKGKNANASCGTVSIAPGTINNRADCKITLKYYQYYQEGYMQTPAYNVNSENLDLTIAIEIGGKTYQVTGEYHDGSEVSIQLPPVSGATLTITSANTGYDSNEHSVSGEQPKATFSGTLTNVNISGPGTVILGTVNLVMQH